jgi:hypothetical protein
LPSSAFVKAKEKGRWFEHLVMDSLRNGGYYVVDLDKERYEVKKQGDFLVKILSNGRWESSAIECKYDEMSEQTGNVCVDLSSINNTQSAIWLYGFPNGSRIDVYSMRISDLAPFARSWPIKRKVGENGWVEAALIPKQTFINQSFVHHWKTISV